MGIKASLIWAIELAEDITKGIIVVGYKSPEELFNKYKTYNGVLQYDEFRRAMDDIQIGINHEEEDFSNFFKHVETGEVAIGVPKNDYGRVGIVQLSNTLKRLC